ncbi:MAG: flagellar filament capping protein FliD [Betaproteobacteria bacterium]|nr:flagellar filament capping protein FliD [Betaproteobacteria bacterium]
MAITASGIGSNLDVNGIVSQLMTIEQQPVKKLDTKEASYQAKLSAYGTVKSGLATLQDATSSLTNTASFQSIKATPSNTSILTASANSTAIPGKYSVDISQLAQAQNLAAAGQLNTTSNIGSGTLSFEFGTITKGALGTFDSATGKYTGATFTRASGSTVRTVNIESGSTSLGDIRDAINAADIGVTASIVSDGSATPYRLVLTSPSGVTSSMKISVTGDQALSDLMAHDPGNDSGQNLAETITAQNAEIKVNGISASMSSNSIADVIHGVTLNLLEKTTSTATVTVARDTSAIKTSLDAFVKAYNEIAKPLKELSTYNVVTKQAPVLNGDSAVLAIQSQMRNVISAKSTSITGNFKALSQIGVSFQKDGTLTVDSAKLQSAIDLNATEVAMIVTSTGGKLKTLLANLTGSSGPLASKTDGVNLGMKLLNAQRTKLNDRLVITEQRYRNQYAALDSLLGSMKTTSDALTQQLAGLPNSSSKSG